MSEGEDTVREVAARWGQALRKLRGDRTLRATAEALGVHEITYSRMEKGELGTPKLDRVLAVLEHYGVNAELIWTPIEAAAVKPRPGVPVEMERRLASAEAVAQLAVEEIRKERKRRGLRG